MRVLIFGAGSIGQTYGYILQRADVTVDVFVRPKYVDQARQGYRIYNRRQGFDNPQLFKPDQVLSAYDRLRREDYDLALLCISSTALVAGWLPDFAAAIGDTAVVSLTPGMKDEEILLQHLEKSQLGRGLITAVSYPAPLPGVEDCEPGTAFWFPPVAKALFEGPDAVVKPLVQALNKGGMKSRATTNVGAQSRMGSAVLMPVVAVLETLDWSLEALKKSGAQRKFLAQAIDEALTLMESRYKIKRPLPMRLLGPTTLKGLLTVAPKVPPFNLATYLQVHFTKVGDQTRLFLDDYCQSCDERGMDCPALHKLRDELP